MRSDKTQENTKPGSPFPAGDNKAARNRHDSITKTGINVNKCKQIFRPKCRPLALLDLSEKVFKEVRLSIY